MSDRCEYVLTPLGAALVEALPDRALVCKIKDRFRRRGTCPTSQVFPTAQAVKDFYRAKGER